MIFISKAGKINHYTPKDFLLKTMERLIDVYVRSILIPQNFCEAQHAYQKGGSIETALRDVVGTDESALKTECVLALFLDIEGAFKKYPQF